MDPDGNRIQTDSGLASEGLVYKRLQIVNCACKLDVSSVPQVYVTVPSLAVHEMHGRVGPN